MFGRRKNLAGAAHRSHWVAIKKVHSWPTKKPLRELASVAPGLLPKKSIFWQHPEVSESGPPPFSKVHNFKIFKISMFSINGLHMRAKNHPRPDFCTEFWQESNGQVLGPQRFEKWLKHPSSGHAGIIEHFVYSLIFCSHPIHPSLMHKPV